MASVKGNITLLDQIPLFSLLQKDEKAAITEYIKTKTFKANESLYRPGEKAFSLYIVKRGKIRIYRLAENGKEQLIRILIAGEFTGELALFKEGIYEAFAESLEETELYLITHDDFKKVLLEYPAVSVTMLQVLAKRLSDSEEQTSWIGTESVRDRLLHYLSRTAVKENGKMVVTLNMTKRDLASYLGTTPETLSREWTKLENEQKIITYQGKLIIRTF